MTIKDYEKNEIFEKSEKIRQNVKKIQNKIKIAAEKANRSFREINLMAVTKTVDPFFVNIAIEEGVYLLGENKVQEFKQKFNEYKKDNVKIHFIGHLQTNKVKDILDKVDCVESVDSLKLCQVISKEAEKLNKNISILLEINVGKEESKFGFNPEEIIGSIKTISKFKNIKIDGLMSIPPKKDAEYYFNEMQKIYIDISKKKIDNVNMRFLSMGMSNDFEKAIEYGANIIRIGSFLFGNRN